SRKFLSPILSPVSGRDGSASAIRPISFSSLAGRSRCLIRSPRRRRGRQIFTDLCQELTRADGLSDIGIATRCTGLVLSPARRGGGEGDTRDSPRRRVVFGGRGCLITVEPRQLDIHENEVRWMRCRRCKPRLAVFCLNDLEISAREQIPQDLPI